MQSVPGIFSAGLQLTELRNPDMKRFKPFWRALQNTWLKLYTTRLATVAAISVGVGAMCSLILRCNRIHLVYARFVQGILQQFTVIHIPQGHAIAGGCLMALACDYRIMSEGKYRIGLNETQVVSLYGFFKAKSTLRTH